MNKSKQLSLFDYDSDTDEYDGTTENEERSGSFVDNMKLPIHRWFRYSAGFSADWVEKLIGEKENTDSFIVLDPFVGSGTTLIASDKLGIKSIGVEAHPFVARIAKAKLLWDSPIADFVSKATEVLHFSMKHEDAGINKIPKLIRDCYSLPTINKLNSLKNAWLDLYDGSQASELTWLAITAILRSTSKAGTAQWQYILPNKEKKNIVEPYAAYKAYIEMVASDMKRFQQIAERSKAKLIAGDARQLLEIEEQSIDMVITSPPYANNYDYADATRLEMTFWGEIESWGDLHESVRNKLIVSSSQHASKERLELDKVLKHSELHAIRTEIIDVCMKLAEERSQHGGKKHYHTMIAAYFLDLSKIFRELRRVCKAGSQLCFIIGDSAPYGVYVPVDHWLGDLAISWGFKSYHFEKLRDRNIKWKNRKHRVPLQEGRLWIEG